MRNAMWVGGGITGMGEIPMLGVKEKGIAKVIRDIFRNGEQGFFYDPSDIEAMYQDAAGITTVNATGQPVGLMLDKSKGLVLGAEIFDDSKVNLTYQTTRLSAGYYNIFSTSDTSAVQNNNASGTKWRVVEYEIMRIGSGSLRLDYTSGGNIVVPSTLGRRKVYIYGDRVTFVRRTTPTDIDFKIHSIKEITGNHAYQTTSAARPILQQSPILGVNYVPDSMLAEPSKWDTRAISGVSVIGNKLVFNNVAAYHSSVSCLLSKKLTVGKQYLLSYTVSEHVSGNVRVQLTGSATVGTADSNKNGRLSLAITATAENTLLGFQSTTAGTTLNISEVYLHEITGYRTDQNCLEFDSVDDNLVTNLPAPLTNATVLRAIPNVGTQVKYNQTLPLLYEDSTNHSGLVAIDRTLTRSEQLRLMTELDKKAGAVGYDTTMFKMFDPTQQGFYYDPNDISTMFQDAAGTIPVTAVGQPVGLIRDKSGRNNHAYQTVSASRPILQKTPILGNELLINGDGSDGLSTWAASASTLTNNAGVFTLTASGQFGKATNSLNLVVGKTYLLSIDVVNNTANASIQLIARKVTTSENYGVISINSARQYSFLFTPTEAGTRIIVEHGAAAPTGSISFDNVSVKEFLGYHTNQNYLAFDGIDDFLQTNSIDFTATDKVSLFVGVRKLGNSSPAVVVELSTAWANNPGTFALLAPSYVGGAGYTAAARLDIADTTNQQAVVGSGYPTPVSSVVTALLTTDTKLRVDGALKGTNNGNKGSGSYGNYPLYIGRRGGSSIAFNGNLYGLIGIGKLVSDDETAIIEKELAKRTGVTLNV